jgi:hypothetical protein
MLQTLQALLIMHFPDASASAGDAARTAALSAGPALPRTVRMLHRVVVGLGGERTAEFVAVDTIISVTAAAVEGTAPQTLLLSSRRALPIGVDPNDPTFKLRVFPWP